ncbi:MAG: IS982 family transposase, partial [Parcubacteria group bacterium CG23_combo_of_CG06-09_8_20_14_all_35_9]
MIVIRFTSGNVDDRVVFLKLNKDLLGLFIADRGYISKKLQKDFYIEGKRLLLAKPRK